MIHAHFSNVEHFMCTSVGTYSKHYEDEWVINLATSKYIKGTIGVSNSPQF